MPELPEVEVARRAITRWARGGRVVAAHAADRMVVKGSPAAFARALVGRTLQRVERRGKRLRIVFSDGLLFAHFGMTGKWVKRAPDAPAERIERARIAVALPRGQEVSIRYVDPRRLGRLEIATDDVRAWRELGPDALEGGAARHLAEALAGSRRTVKETLMDQTVIAGVGNIYATEALFAARIDPRTRGAALGPPELRALARAVRAVLLRSLRMAEAADEEELTYVSESRASNPFAVYGRARRPCLRCGAPLRNVSLGGRTTTFCAFCQRRVDSRTRGE
jgi:formamidopyrimidine-DNA glycosylase